MEHPDRYQAIVTSFEEAFDGFVRLGQWANAVRARSQLASWAWQHERRSAYFDQIDQAIRLADDHGLADQSARLRTQRFEYSLMSDSSGKSIEDLKKELPQLLSSVANLLVLGARHALALDEPATAGEYFASAARIADQLPHESRRVVELDYASYLEGRSRFEEALAHGEQGLRAARLMKMPALVAQALATTIPLRCRLDTPDQTQRAEAELAELRSMASPFDWVMALILRSQCRFDQRRFEEALADADAALAAGPAAGLRRLALMVSALPLAELGRYQEALDATQEAVALLGKAEKDDGGSSRSRDRVVQRENLHLVAAWLGQRLQHPAEEIFSFAEAGRARNLNSELSPLGPNAAETAGAPFEQVRAMLAEDSAALLLFGVVHWGSLAILVDFENTQPRVFQLDLAARDLNRLLSPPEITGEDSTAWTDVIYAAVPELSTALLTPPLARALRQLAGGCKTLYIVPDTFLYRLPFAALTLPAVPGMAEAKPDYLAAQFPLAYAPSAAVLAACRARRGAPGRDCLAYGMGESGGLYFANQARAVSELPWHSSRRLDERTKPAQFLAEAANFSVIHLACHGSTSSDTRDMLKASQLEMFSPDVLTAADVYAASPPLCADLVFLNACQSGRFRMSARSEPDGFWRAFLKAGARSLVATLSHVDPTHANALALSFYRHWLEGESKAVALQSAQRECIRGGLAPEHWASHILIGDAR
jgi:tetratricopeptide (TPR) repeat protein